MALIIAGDRSGVGKTTCTLCLLAYLKRSGATVQSFKVGPDYIDSMFHQYVTGRPCRNLDPILTSQDYVRYCFYRQTRDVEFALIEGVMGLFDGVGWSRESIEAEASCQPTSTEDLQTNFASTAHISLLLNLPILLIIDCSRLSGSVAAIVHGYRSFDPRVKLAGVVLNRVGSDRHLDLLKSALEPLNLPVLGVLRREDKITIPDRHLGLVPTAEISELDSLIDRLYSLAKDCFNWKLLIPLLKGSHAVYSPKFQDPIPKVPFPRFHSQDPIKIAISRDAAFSFYYQDNLDIFQQLGAELIPWSPLTDCSLPEGVRGLYFGGGFPEIFARQLAENMPALKAVRSAILQGMPTYAECGGLMYLCESIADFEGNHFPMVGVLPTGAIMGKQLTLGYRKAVALRDSQLIKTGELVRGHEFHRSQLTGLPSDPLFETTRYNDLQNLKVAEGWQLYKLHASYIHLHWGGGWEIPQRFLQQSDRFRAPSVVD